MKKLMVIIIVLYMASSLVRISAQTRVEYYGIKLADFKYETNADNYIKALKTQGIDPCKISTSIYSVFFDIYSSRDSAMKDLNTARRYVSEAYVVNLNDNQQVAYAKLIAPLNAGSSSDEPCGCDEITPDNLGVSDIKSTPGHKTEAEGKKAPVKPHSNLGVSDTKTVPDLKTESDGKKTPVKPSSNLGVSDTKTTPDLKTESDGKEAPVKPSSGTNEEIKQITINKLSDGKLEYTYRVVNDIELRGINGESKWFFLVEKDMKATFFKFNLYCRVNELIRREISYFTVYINDLPVKSMRIKDADSKLLNSWEIVIPTSLLKEGYNELKVRSYSRISDDACEDDKNIANWVIIDGNTNYVIHYRRNLSSGNISNFSKPFIGMHADDAPGIGVVIPDRYTDQEISAALTLIAHMKFSGSAFDVPSTLVKAGDCQISDFDSLIYVGNYQSVPKDLKGVIRSQENLYADSAHIYRATLDKGRKPVFMIVSDNGDRLMEAVKALKNNDLKIQMPGKYIKLKPRLDTTIKEQRVSDYIYLKDLGINGIEVKGRNLQVTNIGIRIPTNQMLADEANITLNTRYSDNLDFEKSLVSVYINGIPVGSQRLFREKRNLHTMTFYVPEELRRETYFDVRIVFDLIPGGIIDCKRYLASVPWAYIIDDSSYFFPKQERSLKLLNNLPFPYSRNDDLDSTTIVLPDNPSRDDYRIAGKIAALAGIGVKNNEGIIDAVKGSQLDEKHRANNLVIFGAPGENSAIKSINNFLWFKYNTQFSAVLSNEKIELLPDTSVTATFLELKTSPYNQDKGMMTITSLNKGSLIDSMVFLEDAKRGSLTGDAAIISQNGELQNFRFQKDEEARPVISKAHTVGKNMWKYFIFTGALILFLIIGLGFYLYKNKKK